MKKSNAYILMYFVLITLVALMTSCATTVHSCEDSFKPKIRENYNSRGTNWW
jgi:hypothetical protein